MSEANRQQRAHSRPPTGLDASVRARVGGFELDVDLRVAPGRTVAVLGPNGAGKTTLLRAIAGLQSVDEGRVVLDGTVLDEPSSRTWVPPERRRIGVVFQEHLLFPHLSVVDNVAFGLRARGVDRHAARASALDWLGRMGLADRAGDAPQQLSGGQAQRVALARALAGEPALLLLDEPLSALDASTRTTTRRDLRRHLAEVPGVRLLVTHDPVDAAALADELVVLEGGQVTQAGTPDELRRRPRSRWVAELVGVNLLRGVARAGRVDLGRTELVAADAVDGEVLAVVHPRAVAVHRVRPEGTPRNVWPVRVTAIDPEGERARLTLVGALELVAEVTPGAVADLGLVEGDEVWASVKATEVTLSSV